MADDCSNLDDDGLDFDDDGVNWRIYREVPSNVSWAFTLRHKNRCQRCDSRSKPKIQCNMCNLVWHRECLSPEMPPEAKVDGNFFACSVVCRKEAHAIRFPNTPFDINSSGVRSPLNEFSDGGGDGEGGSASSSDHEVNHSGDVDVGLINGTFPLTPDDNPPSGSDDGSVSPDLFARPRNTSPRPSPSRPLSHNLRRRLHNSSVVDGLLTPPSSPRPPSPRGRTPSTPPLARSRSLSSGRTRSPFRPRAAPTPVNYMQADPNVLVEVTAGMHLGPDRDCLPGPWGRLSLDDVCLLPPPSPRIPAHLLRAYSAAVNRTALLINSTAPVYDHGLQRLLNVLPKLCLAPLRRRWVKQALKVLEVFPNVRPAYVEQLVEAVGQISNRPRPARRPTPDQQRAKACRRTLTSTGSLSKAVRALLSDGLASVDEATLQKLRDLHPPASLPPSSPTRAGRPGAVYTASDGDIVSHILKLDPASASGIGGWTPELLRVAAEAMPPSSTPDPQLQAPPAPTPSENTCSVWLMQWLVTAQWNVIGFSPAGFSPSAKMPPAASGPLPLAPFLPASAAQWASG